MLTQHETRPAAGIGAALLTRMDLSDPEVVKDAEFELTRCVADFDYARWAKRWGPLVIARLSNAETFDASAWVSIDDYDAQVSAFNRLIHDAKAAANTIGETLKNASGPKTEAINQTLKHFGECIDIAEEVADVPE